MVSEINYKLLNLGLYDFIQNIQNHKKEGILLYMYLLKQYNDDNYEEFKIVLSIIINNYYKRENFAILIKSIVRYSILDNKIRYIKYFIKKNIISKRYILTHCLYYKNFIIFNCIMGTVPEQDITKIINMLNNKYNLDKNYINSINYTNVQL